MINCPKGRGSAPPVYFPCHSEPVLTLVVAIRVPRPRARRRGTPKPPLCKGRWRKAPEGLSKGVFRAPARGTFALGGKSTQKRRSNLRFENPLRGFACCLSCSLLPRERCTSEISPKCCIVSASLFAVAFALKCRAVQPCYLWQDCFYKSRSKAATYLCRFAAKARFDNRPHSPEGVSKEGGPQPSLFGRSRMGDFQGGRKIETSFPLEWRFWLLLPLLAKVTRRRLPAPAGAELPSFAKKESTPSETKKKKPSPTGHKRRPPAGGLLIIHLFTPPSRSGHSRRCCGGRPRRRCSFPHCGTHRTSVPAGSSAE